MSEKLSALIDNELDDLERARVLKEFGDDHGLAELWSRYHIIGLAMRREAIVRNGDLVDRVSARLKDETAGTGEHGAARPGPTFRSASRLAVAASIAGVLVLGGLVIQIYDRTGDPASPATAQVATADDATVGDATRWEGADPRTEDALNALLVEHSEFTSASGMNGLTAYTKFVAYDSP